MMLLVQIPKLPLAKWINDLVDWLTQFSGFFNSITNFFQAIINAFQWVFDLLPVWLFIIIILALLIGKNATPKNGAYYPLN